MAKKEISSEVSSEEAKQDPRIIKLTQRAKQVNELLGGKEIKNVREAGALMDALTMQIDRAFEDTRLEVKLKDLKLDLSGDNEMRLRNLMGPVSDLSVAEAQIILGGLADTIQRASNKHLEDVPYKELKIAWEDAKE
jgi:hypothetical protein